MASEEATRVGPEGYVHGWIKVDPGAAKPNSTLSRAEAIAKIAKAQVKTDLLHNPGYRPSAAERDEIKAAVALAEEHLGHDDVTTRLLRKALAKANRLRKEPDAIAALEKQINSGRSAGRAWGEVTLPSWPDFGTLVARTAETPIASTVHEPFGSPAGPGLWHHKGLQLPAYIQHVAHHLVGQGHPESKAIEMAVGIVRNWAHGHDGHGNQVHPDVQAAAVKAMAEWEAAKAAAHGSTGRS